MGETITLNVALPPLCSALLRSNAHACRRVALAQPTSPAPPQLQCTNTGGGEETADLRGLTARLQLGYSLRAGDRARPAPPSRTVGAQGSVANIGALYFPAPPRPGSMGLA